MKISVIIPYCNEWPQIAFTIRSVAEALRDFDFEIIAVDNWCSQVEIGPPVRLPDRGHPRKLDPTDKNATYGIYRAGPPGLTLNRVNSHIEAMAHKHDWLKYMRYEEKLSHWQAKDAGVWNSTGGILWFLDAHVIPSHNIAYGLRYYMNNYEELNGTLHFPWTYHILESQRLIYKMVFNHDKGVYHYSTLNFYWRDQDEVFEVPAATTCGCVMTRAIYDKVGGWPSELGIYGGGENFLNYTLAVLGMKKWIYPLATVHHHGEKRGYNWNYDDYHANRAIATYLFGGSTIMWKYLDQLGSPKVIRETKKRILGLLGHRDKILDQQKIDFKEWVDSWKQKGIYVLEEKGT